MSVAVQGEDTAARSSLCLLTMAALCCSMLAGSGDDAKESVRPGSLAHVSGQVSGVQGPIVVVVVVVVVVVSQRQ